MKPNLPIAVEIEISCANDIEHAGDQLRYAGEAYLRAMGWVSSSKHPGSYIMWTKKIDRKTYHLHYKDAVEFQSHLEAK